MSAVCIASKEGTKLIEQMNMLCNVHEDKRLISKNKNGGTNADNALFGAIIKNGFK